MMFGEFLDLFAIHSSDGATIETASNGSNHGYALLLIGLIAVVATFLARSTRQWRPAAAAAALGALALIIVLAGDLPDTMRSGLTDSRRTGSASPAIGFWVELIATLLVIGGSSATAWVLHRDAKSDLTRS